MSNAPAAAEESSLSRLYAGIHYRFDVVAGLALGRATSAIALLADLGRELKAQLDGEIIVAGPGLAQVMTDVVLIDEYRIYLHPVVVGSGKPFFAALGRRRAFTPASEWTSP